MKKRFLLIVLASLFFSCVSRNSKAQDSIVLIKTKYGTMKVKLYNNTPQHRDNFVKLVKEGYYNDLLFHRVIKDFMIQGGDPDSKAAPAGKRLGVGGPEYQIPAEIKSANFHKKGALAAARTGDQANPERKSSGSQFYIVQGKVFSIQELDQIEEKAKIQAINGEMMKLYKDSQQEVMRLQREQKKDSLNIMIEKMRTEALTRVDTNSFKISATKRNLYTNSGGTPFLDGGYTVFGEVVEGLSIIDSIASVSKDNNDRPLDDLKMNIEIFK